MWCCAWINDHLFLVFSGYSPFPFVWFWCFICGCFVDIIGLFNLIVCFIIILLEWGPVAGCSQVCVIWFYFIQYHFAWLPHLYLYYTLRGFWSISMMLGTMLHLVQFPTPVFCFGWMLCSTVLTDCYVEEILLSFLSFPFLLNILWISRVGWCIGLSFDKA